MSRRQRASRIKYTHPPSRCSICGVVIYDKTEKEHGMCFKHLPSDVPEKKPDEGADSKPRKQRQPKQEQPKRISVESYNDYINSDIWKEKARMVKDAAGNRCQVCYGRKMLNVHHRTYERLGVELISDLVVLCKDCHQLFHENGKLKR